MTAMQALLSEHWHAVRGLRPRLRDGVEPLHRHLRGKPWVLLLDPVSQRFHRLAPQVWRVLQLFDGRRTLDEVWSAACAQADDSAGSAAQGAAVAAADGALADAVPDGAISQHELVQLVSTLHANDLLQSQVSPDAGEVFERWRRQKRARWKQGWLNPLSLKLPLLHPEPWFARQVALARALAGWPALLAWLVLVLPAALLAAQHWGRLTENLSDRVLSASNLVLLWFVYPLVKAVHEWAHGLAVKAGGGTVREIGVMFIVFTPVPYVDASSSYRFPSKWARAGVAAAGIMAELALGAVALYVWLLAEPGLTTAVAYNVVLIAGVSTLVVNGNPLMRYDGYFIACDLLEVPNLAQRANQYLVYLLDRYGYGARDAQPPLAAHGERAWLLVYGLVAPVYRLLVTVGLIVFVATEYLLVGALMAVLAAWSALVLPLWRGWRHLVAGPTLARRRGVARRRTLGALVLAAGFAAWVPMPFYSLHQAVVWLPDEAIVRAEVPGHVARVHCAPGERVATGAPLLDLQNLPLSAEHASASAGLAQAHAQLRRAEVDDRGRVAPLRAELASREARLAETGRRDAALSLHAAVAGRWTPSAPTALEGRWFKRGEVVGWLVDGPSSRLRMAVTQEDMDLLRERIAGGATRVQVRLAGEPQRLRGARVLREVPGGEQELVSAALGTSGGGEIAVDPSVAGGTRSLQRVFDVELLLDEPAPGARFGDRAHVRIDLGALPLGRQAFLRLRQAFLARLSL